jgi:diguanylate cyclase (GGDEF)-like protein
MVRRRVSLLVVPLLVICLAFGAAGTVAALQSQAQHSREQVVTIAGITADLAQLESAPFNARARAGGSPAGARAEISADDHAILSKTAALLRSGPRTRQLIEIPGLLRETGPTIAAILRLAGSRAGYAQRATDPLHAQLIARVTAMTVRLRQAAAAAGHRADVSSSEAVIGSSGTILVLVLLFAALYQRVHAARATAERFSAENVRLLEQSRDEAVTDPLTSLGNRRAYQRDLNALLADAGPDSELVTALFDLNGFKLYNDTFGHGAGDALLVRLAAALQSAVPADAGVYRLGGDEFCVVARGPAGHDVAVIQAAANALQDKGEGWEITCSWGMAWIPSDADSPGEALRLADSRMYAQKAARTTPAGQAAATLMQVLAERDRDLDAHTNNVARLAFSTATRLKIDEPELSTIRIAAHLHDIGKTALPESILDKPDQLDDREWAFVKQHTIVGERIMKAAPALTAPSKLVRSSHERIDGRGYPDGLSGDAIPLGAKIIAACDAYDAMTSNRCYGEAVTPEEACAELRRCSGTQFSTEVVDALCAILADEQALPGSVSTMT